ncbi:MULTISPECIES: bactofilin family protein [Comamonas]|jgi:cytoskeletal protein CcmA (bactofilin family)|uniref:Polymer-forming cytoskeletal protein n=1 Tax=Comamonas thiooxydans TaxID=363952 RepID=A0AA42PZ42_9BURK|nr:MULTISPECIES: polymer-forming cytoskeletal protein [Comamonas]KKI15473.1 integral membrane protein CcmA [Comamonas thiooxydans]MDH1251260.1 polymer-forming cytoskeletal protein [Comamonas thiooxydans]MDH1333284.1 polymer-forming cytoskeletal protein [Comamonas thiooxydans]MDH1474545.1 polymer-forming cytoskeletal protein [Comamonas thiooxydans]MDH1738943.1 polymer-forming cytoskeletal protein [Comamonas thiooxydans]
MAVQNPFFGKRDNDNFPSRSSVTGLSTANTAATSGASSLSNAGLGTAPSSPMRAAATAAPTAPVAEENGGSKLTVGPNIKLKGVEITDCDTLVVEGTVEATMNSRVIKIAEQGAFHGTAEIDIAEIHGKFDGTLTVREKLVIYGSGKVSGTIRYGKVVIEEGGELTGQIEAGTRSGTSSSSNASASAWSKSSAGSSTATAAASSSETTGSAAVA